MTWNHDEAKVTVDLKDPSLFTIELKNAGQLPILFALTEVSPQNAEASPLQGKVTVSMVTRRSTVNPGEIVKFRIKLPEAASAFDSKAEIGFMLVVPTDSFDVTMTELQEAEAAGGFRPTAPVELEPIVESKSTKRFLRKERS
jgi:hypothetical protein